MSNPVDCRKCTHFQGIAGGSIACDVVPWRPPATMVDSSPCSAFIPASAPASPAPALPLLEAAPEAADHLMSAAALRFMRDGEELADRLQEVEARLRSAIAAEEERQKAPDPRDATIRDLRALLGRCASTIEAVDELQLDCIHDGLGAPNGDCDCNTCETVRELRATLAALRSAGVEPTPADKEPMILDLYSMLPPAARLRYFDTNGSCHKHRHTACSICAAKAFWANPPKHQTIKSLAMEIKALWPDLEVYLERGEFRSHRKAGRIIVHQGKLRTGTRLIVKDPAQQSFSGAQIILDHNNADWYRRTSDVRRWIGDRIAEEKERRRKRQ